MGEIFKAKNLEELFRGSIDQGMSGRVFAAENPYHPAVEQGFQDT